MDTVLASPKALSSWDKELTVQVLVHAGATNARGGATTWPSADLAIFLPVVIAGPFTIRKAGCENGTNSGNVDLGVYTAELSLVVSTGSTAMAGGSVWQEIDVTDTTIPAGLYYIAMVMNNTTGANAASAVGTGVMRASGAFQMASAFPLPATATRTAISNSYWPSFQFAGPANVI